jgi:hypothetical protein
MLLLLLLPPPPPPLLPPDAVNELLHCVSIVRSTSLIGL